MHQQRTRISSPVNSAQNNPLRSNNPRDVVGAAGRARAGSETASQDSAAMPDGGEASGSSGPSRESIKKLDQIIQNFHLKAAVLILQSRISTSPSAGSKGRKSNKWFQIDTDDIDDFRDELKIWKQCGGFENRPPPMVIELFLDASQLAPSQTLVTIDDNGKRWDVLEALNPSDSSSDGSFSSTRPRNTEVVLERWKIELKCIPNDSPDDFGPTLPTIYKRSIVFFRSLFVMARVMPCWKFSQQSLIKQLHPSLKVRCRVSTRASSLGEVDPLRQPLYDNGGRDAATDYMFGDLEVPVGRFYASVSYRNDCDFRVDDSESVLSSRFMGVDEQSFRPSLAQRAEHGRRDSAAEIGSLPPSRRHSHNLGDVPPQTYGSLSTFHGAGALGTSPISALKAVRPIGSDTSSPSESASASIEPEPPHSLPITGRSTAMRPSLRHAEGAGRRPSVSFQPFKAGSLSASPRLHDEVPSSPGTLARLGMSSLTQNRNRASLTAGMAASLRGAPPPAEAGQSSSPRPGAGRYSSSFSNHRRGRPSFGGASRGEDDQGSSGKQSLSSSMAPPDSGLLAEAVGTSSGSFQTDDDNISEFLKMIDSKKNLSSFDTTKGGESTTKVTRLTKFQQMKDSNIALTESMNSSMHLHRSSSSSSRQLTSVPGMVPASMSASSSPSKPLSPHTPHTPAIPSRLSENSIANYTAQERARAAAAPVILATEEEAEEAPVSQEGTTAIDIPLSPRLLQPNRRASSVAQQTRGGAEEDDTDLAFGAQRSISLGADDRDLPILSSLMRQEGGSEAEANLQPPANIRPSNRPRTSSSAERESKNPPRGLLSNFSDSPRRSRYGMIAGRASPPAPPSPAHAAGPSSSARYGAVGRASGEGEADDEPLVFDMSEIGQGHNRRSLEEGRGGKSLGSGYADRGGFDSSKGSRRGW